MADVIPLLRAKHYRAPSVFLPENMLREARRQKRLPPALVPSVCVLDPDGDILRQLRAEGRAEAARGWACYHSELFVFTHQGEQMGIIGCAVGAPYAVLLAEELFASGCEMLLSVTSSGVIDPSREPPYFILIDRALRDEGTSYHYLPPSDFAASEPLLADRMSAAMAAAGMPVVRGATWTTDAPFRETEAAIAAARAHGVLAVEMEAAALYAFAAARQRPVICFAHVTNQLAQIEGDFEKGEANGAHDALDLLAVTARAWRVGR
jgi:uridine phosphorylase